MCYVKECLICERAEIRVCIREYEVGDCPERIGIGDNAYKCNDCLTWEILVLEEQEEEAYLREEEEAILREEEEANLREEEEQEEEANLREDGEEDNSADEGYFSNDERTV